MTRVLCFLMLCTYLLTLTTSHHRRRQRLHHLLGLTLDVTTTTQPPQPSHFSFVVAPTDKPKQNLLIALDSISTAATLGKEYDGNHDHYTNPTTNNPYRETSPTPAPGYVGGLGSFSSDTFNKYYANNGMYGNDLGNGAGYWGGGNSNNYNNGGGNRNNGPVVESKYSYDNSYDRGSYDMSYDSGGYDYGAGSMVGSIASYLSYIIMDPGSILMAAAALSLKALVLNLVLVATNRTRRRKRSGEGPFDDDLKDGSTQVLDSIMDTLQITLEAPERCRARMFCEAGRRIRNGVVSTSGNVASIARYFGTKMEERAYLVFQSVSPPFSKQWPPPNRRQCAEDFTGCSEQMRKLNTKFMELSRYLPYIELIPVKDTLNVLSATSEEPT